jgi:hypothetical protein
MGATAEEKSVTLKLTKTDAKKLSETLAKAKEPLAGLTDQPSTEHATFLGQIIGDIESAVKKAENGEAKPADAKPATA